MLKVIENKPKSKYTPLFLWWLLKNSNPKSRINFKDLNFFLCWGKYREKFNFEAKVLNPILNDLKNLKLNLIFIRENQDYIFEFEVKQQIINDNLKEVIKRDKKQPKSIKRAVATQRAMDNPKVKIKQLKGMINRFKAKGFNTSKMEGKLKQLEQN